MDNTLIYDIGMHNGDDTAFYLACGFRVIAVEADPDLVALANKRFKTEIDSKKLVILNVGIAEHTAQAAFWINEEDSTKNSFNRELTARYGHPHHSILINCRRLDEILSEYGVPFYLKIDIENNDIVCCNQLTPATKPKFISVEMSQMELLIRLRNLGYDRFKLILQFDLSPVEPQDTKLRMASKWVHKATDYPMDDRKLLLRIRRAVARKLLNMARAVRAKLGRTPQPFKSRMLPEWNFAEGASGSFGEDLPGKWLSYEEAAYLWHRELTDYQKRGREYWCDLHATTSTENPNFTTTCS
ncbi:MAG: FkbM family methyltransferase [Methylacidiphilales bacterium]|nr:FkbM family methyltransferase [Candidatus Methylacidiphilales bacterium]